MCVVGAQNDWVYAPGDSIGIDCCNSDADVDAFLGRLGEPDPQRLVTMSALTPPAAAEGKAQAAGLPQHLATPTPVSLRALVAARVDLRALPKKAVLRLLADYASVEEEAADLYLLSSIKGKQRFRAEVISDLLYANARMRAYVCACMCMHAFMINACMQVCVFVFVFVFVCVCMYVRVCVCMLCVRMHVCSNGSIRACLFVMFVRHACAHFCHACVPVSMWTCFLNPKRRVHAKMHT